MNVDDSSETFELDTADAEVELTRPTGNGECSWQAKVQTVVSRGAPARRVAAQEGPVGNDAV